MLGNKKIRYSLYSVAIFIVAISASFTTLFLINSQDGPTDASTAINKSITDIYKEIDEKISPDLSRKGYSSKQSEFDIYVNYQANGKQYSVPLNTGKGPSYSRTDASKNKNDPAIIDNIDKYFNGLKMEKVQGEQLTGFSVYQFLSSNILCFLVSRDQVSSTIPASISVSCINKISVDEAYKLPDLLLQAYSASGSTEIKPTHIKLLTYNEDSVTLYTATTITKNQAGEQSSNEMYFISTDNVTYEYIGTRPTPSVDIESSFTFPDELRSTIDSSRYKDFLNKYIK